MQIDNMAIMGNGMELPEKVEPHYDSASPRLLPHYSSQDTETMQT